MNQDVDNAIGGYTGLPNNPASLSLPAHIEHGAQKHFEEWCGLAPIIPTDKNGDGEYENELAFNYWKAGEFMYKKGVWDGAYHMQNMVQKRTDENEVVLLMHRAYRSDRGSDTQRMTRVYRELVASGLLKNPASLCDKPEHISAQVQAQIAPRNDVVSPEDAREGGDLQRAAFEAWARDSNDSRDRDDGLLANEYIDLRTTNVTNRQTHRIYGEWRTENLWRSWHTATESADAKYSPVIEKLVEALEKIANADAGMGWVQFCDYAIDTANEALAAPLLGRK